ncbi:AzlC family ABC transporter permease [Acidaminococcus intestini]|nr:AzlC family ABC transporter permease [Acidaminococcus intestini]
MTATLPIAAGFLFIGAAYGFYMQRMGFSFWYPMLMAMIIFGGSLEFVTVTMLLSPFAPLQAFLMALMIQARHLFYGIAMLDRYKGMGWKKPFLIYGMCDETFALIFAKSPIPTLTQAGSCFLLRCLTTRTGLQAQPLAAFLVPSFPLTQKVLTLS